MVQKVRTHFLTVESESLFSTVRATSTVTLVLTVESTHDVRTCLEVLAYVIK